LFHGFHNRRDDGWTSIYSCADRSDDALHRRHSGFAEHLQAHPANLGSQTLELTKTLGDQFRQ
jgi:hypothetical protein